MKRHVMMASLAAVSILASGLSAQAKTLVYCSEGSPEGFNPAIYTAGTTFDASSRQVFNRLVEFERGTTKITPALAESWDVSDNGLEYTFNLRKNVKFHSTKGFKPSRDFNADDVLFSFGRQHDPNHPYHKVSGGQYEYFVGMDMPAIIKSIDRLGDHKVRFVLNKPEAPFIANMGMDFASDHVGRVCRPDEQGAGTPEKVDLNPVGTGPFQLVSYQKDAVIRYKAHPDYWAGKADRRPDLRHHAGSQRCAGRSSRPASATSCPIRTRPTSKRSKDPAIQPAAAGAGRPERRLSRLQHPEEALYG